MGAVRARQSTNKSAIVVASKMNTQNQRVLLLSVVCLGVAAAVIVNSEPIVRLIPADVLRDFPGRCYSWTSGKWYNPNDTWSLKPFCGKARCVALRNTKTNKTFLGEEVTDCGPLVDLEQSPGCKNNTELFDLTGELTQLKINSVVAQSLDVRKVPKLYTKIKKEQRKKQAKLLVNSMKKNKN